MNSITYKAFGDEMIKIAMLNALARGFSTAGRGLKSALKESWHGDNAQWVGKGFNPDNKVPGLKGDLMNVTKILPVGNKSLTVAGALAGVPGVISKQDPMGMERGHAERAADFAGSTLGGMAGMGAGSLLSKRYLGGRYGTLASIGGGLVGGIGSQLALTAPFRAIRQRRQQAAAQAMPQPEVAP